MCGRTSLNLQAVVQLWRSINQQRFLFARRKRFQLYFILAIISVCYIIHTIDKSHVHYVVFANSTSTVVRRVFQSNSMSLSDATFLQNVIYNNSNDNSISDNININFSDSFNEDHRDTRITGSPTQHPPPVNPEEENFPFVNQLNLPTSSSEMNYSKFFSVGFTHNVPITTLTLTRSSSIKSIFSQLPNTRRWINPDGEATTNPFPSDITFLLHNPNYCQMSPTINWLIYFHSHPGHVEYRNALRQTWASEYLMKNMTIKRLFVIGKPRLGNNNDNLFASLLKENVKYGDILMGDFDDSYRNLTLKSIMALKWISTYCSNAKYVIKADDDAFVNIFELTSLINRRPYRMDKSIVCNYWSDSTMPILRNTNSCAKWCVEPSDFPGDVAFPAYCAGASYTMSGDIIGDLYLAAMRTRMFFIDDVFTTGLLPLKLTYPITYQHIAFSWDNDETVADYTNGEAVKYYIVVIGNAGRQNFYFNHSIKKLTPDLRSLLNESFLGVYNI